MPPQGPEAAELRDLAERSRGVVDGLREALGAADTDRRERLDHLGDEATQLVESLASQVADELSQDLARQQEEQAAAARQQIEGERAELQSEREALDAERSGWQAERDAWRAERDQQVSQHEAGLAERSQWETERDAWLAEREQWEAVRNQVEAELAKQEQNLLAERQALEAGRHTDGGADDSVLYEKLEKVVAERDQAVQERAGVEARVGELTAALEQATGGLAAASEVEQELGTLREKFDLVMTDLQAHREHVAALEGELAQRPASAGADPAELEQLRRERDELAQRLQDEKLLASQQAEPSTELEELRARFEMAVEDVRGLRTENEELRQKLENAPATGDAAAAGNDWEAQKQRLLASLSDEGEAVEPERQEERATIAGTLQITDEVVAEKDREIERLQEELQQAAANPAAGGEAVVDEAQAALLDEDAVIQAERQRLTDLEAEWQEKLRQAELELSLERAKISRAQSELEEQQLELETLRGKAGGGEGGESKRRWMDKLGLGGDGK